MLLGYPLALWLQKQVENVDFQSEYPGGTYAEKQKFGKSQQGQFQQSNIYCDIPYCSGDSRYFVYERKNPRLKGRNKTELMVVEIGSWKLYARMNIYTLRAIHKTFYGRRQGIANTQLIKWLSLR